MTVVGGYVYLSIPSTGTSWDAAYGAAYWAPQSMVVSISGYAPGGSWTGTSWNPTSLQFNTAATSYLLSNDATLTLTQIGWANGGLGLAKPSTGSFQWAWHHTAQNATAISSPGLSQQLLTWTVTNNTGKIADFALFQFTSSSLSFSAATGNALQATWLSPGASWTFSLVVSASDPYFYAPEQVDLSKVFQMLTSSTNGVINYAGAAPLTSSGTGENYASGSPLSSLPATGSTSLGVEGDGGNSGGSSVSSVGGPGGIVAQTSTVTGSTVTASNGGTAGPGTGGATDAGLQNNAAAINVGTAAAATSINSSLAAGFNSVTKQEAADTAALIGQIGSSSGGSGTDNTGIEAKLTQIHTDDSGIRSDLEAGSTFSAPAALGSAEAAQTGAATYGGTTVGGSAGASGWSGVSSTILAPQSMVPGEAGAATYGLSWDLSSGPFAAAGAALLSARGIMAFGLVIWFALVCADTVTAYATAIGTTPQATGLASIEDMGPGVAQTKTWLSAGAIVGTMMTFCGSLVAIVEGVLEGQGYGLHSLLQVLDLSAFSYGLGLLDRYFPVSLAVILGMSRAAVPYLAAPLYWASASVIKFLSI